MRVKKKIVAVVVIFVGYYLLWAWGLFFLLQNTNMSKESAAGIMIVLYVAPLLALLISWVIVEVRHPSLMIRMFAWLGT